MTKRELIRELDKYPDEIIVTVAQWTEGMYELFHLSYIYEFAGQGVIKLQPGDEYKENEDDQVQDPG